MAGNKKPELWPAVQLANLMAWLIGLMMFKIVASGVSAAAAHKHRRLIDRRARRIVKK